MDDDRTQQVTIHMGHLALLGPKCGEFAMFGHKVNVQLPAAMRQIPGRHSSLAATGKGPRRGSRPANRPPFDRLRKCGSIDHNDTKERGNDDFSR